MKCKAKAHANNILTRETIELFNCGISVIVMKFSQHIINLDNADT
jgi:hypothetical protein